MAPPPSRRSLLSPGEIIDSTDFLDLAALPARILLVGGGFVSFEFAHIAARAGSTAVIVDRGERPLKNFDPDLVELLVDHGREVGADAADTAGMPLTPLAVSEAKVAASNMIKGSTTIPDYTGVPTAVFTIPELVRVCMLEAEAREHGIDLAVHYSDTSGWYSNYRLGETAAAAKILIDRSNDQIVGAHLLGPEYGELVSRAGSPGWPQPALPPPSWSRARRERPK